MILVNCPEMMLHIDLASNSSFFLQYCHGAKFLRALSFAKYLHCMIYCYTCKHVTQQLSQL